MKRTILILLTITANTILSGQASLPVPRNIQAAYDKGTRDPSGAPGKNYWQNFAAYDIQVRLDPATRLVEGSETIRYVNNSMDTLRRLVFKIFRNIYSRGSTRVMSVDSSDVSSAVKINNLKIDGSEFRTYGRGTNMMVVPKAILPKSVVNITLDFSFILNKGSYIRSGESSKGSFLLAYFFPRIAVYDDIDGWDTRPYLGQAEFYNDFSDFKLAVTIPKDYVVWATGTLTNPEEVLAPVYLERLSAAERSDKVITIIDSADIAHGNITADKPFNTFRFNAVNVTDVAAAISNNDIWRSSGVLVDSSSGRWTRVDAVFNPKKKDFYEVAEFGRKTVQLMSHYFPRWPYPYPHETVFNAEKEGGGMEYPMMVGDGNFPTRALTIDVTLHEIFHTMFPFYTGLNETKYGWMDEGLAFLSNWILTPEIDSSIQSVLTRMDINNYSYFAGNESDVPIYTISTQLDQPAYQYNSYVKPAMALFYLRDMIGDELFLKGLHQFIADWQGKHPMPFDFFNCMNQGTAMNLNWYWDKWYFQKGAPDLAITGLKSKGDSKSVRIGMKGDKPVPVELTVTYSDGSKEKIHRSVSIWEKGSTSTEIKFSSSKKISVLDLGSPLIPDINTKDNHLKVN